MPDPVPFLPDDGSIVFKQLATKDFTIFTTLPTPSPVRYMGGRRRLCMFGPDGTVIAMLQYLQRTWTSEETPPAWDPETFGQMALGPVVMANTELSWNTYHSAWDFELEEAVDLNIYIQVKWRWAWRLGELDSSWDYLHLRWKLGVHQSVDDSMVEGDLVDLVWDRELPEGYDPEDPLTWPGTPWVDAAVPDVVSDPATEENTSVTHFATTNMRLKWPISGPYGYVLSDSGTLGGLPAVVPGGSTKHADWIRPTIHPSGSLPGQI